jgi:membrane protein
MWELRGVSPWQLLTRIQRQIYQDELLGRAAELAYFFLFAIFPLLLFLTTLLGYLAREHMPLGRVLFEFVSSVSPSAEVTALLRDTLAEITAGRSGGKLSLGIAIALLAASNGVLALGRTLNAAYGLRETRRWWSRRLRGVALVIVFAVLIVTALALAFSGGALAEWAADAVDLGAAFPWLLRVAQWTVVLVCAVFSFDLLYNFAPDAGREDRVWFTPGALVGVALWLGASFGFRQYLLHIGYYSRAYGSLGAVIVMLLWFYLSGMAILVGGELNSELSKAEAEAAARAAAEAAAQAAGAETPESEEGESANDRPAAASAGAAGATPPLPAPSSARRTSAGP